MYRVSTKSLIPWFAVLLTALYTGCNTFDEGVAQDVTILSYPSGAEVFIGGELIGKTPQTVRLGSKIGYEVRLSLYGHQTYIADILPQLSDAGRATVQFGFSKQSGAYNELKPNPLIAVLRRTDGTTYDSYEVMMSLIEMNDQRYRAGKIRQDRHKHINNEIIQLFTQ